MVDQININNFVVLFFNLVRNSRWLNRRAGQTRSMFQIKIIGFDDSYQRQ